VQERRDGHREQHDKHGGSGARRRYARLVALQTDGLWLVGTGAFVLVAAGIWASPALRLHLTVAGSGDSRRERMAFAGTVIGGLSTAVGSVLVAASSLLSLLFGRRAIWTALVASPRARRADVAILGGDRRILNGKRDAQRQPPVSEVSRGVQVRERLCRWIRITACVANTATVMMASAVGVEPRGIGRPPGRMDTPIAES
jgi:hypothetical protein